mmetsp:Transcript_24196/g.52804  ORF Transcript_24196/g.52804 Transcript_24196/m.52804 type:complete len:411 (-) Transcript_24196:1045-2277(-)
MGAARVTSPLYSLGRWLEPGCARRRVCAALSARHRPDRPRVRVCLRAADLRRWSSLRGRKASVVGLWLDRRRRGAALLRLPLYRPRAQLRGQHGPVRAPGHWRRRQRDRRLDGPRCLRAQARAGGHFRGRGKPRALSRSGGAAASCDGWRRALLRLDGASHRRGGDADRRARAAPAARGLVVRPRGAARAAVAESQVGRAARARPPLLLRRHRSGAVHSHALLGGALHRHQGAASGSPQLHRTPPRCLFSRYATPRGEAHAATLLRGPLRCWQGARVPQAAADVRYHGQGRRSDLPSATGVCSRAARSAQHDGGAFAGAATPRRLRRPAAHRHRDQQQRGATAGDEGTRGHAGGRGAWPCEGSDRARTPRRGSRHRRTAARGKLEHGVPLSTTRGPFGRLHCQDAPADRE